MLKKCPLCGLNYIKYDESICSVCNTDKKENYIIECLDENMWGKGSNCERITFAKMENSRGYEFLGMYKLKNQQDGVRFYIKVE